MSNKKNIDRLFQEKFKDFEQKPSNKVWLHIENELKKDKERKIIPFWWKLSGVAAILLLGTLGFIFLNNDNDKQNITRDKNQVVIENASGNDSVFTDEKIIKKGEIVTQKTVESEQDVLKNNDGSNKNDLEILNEDSRFKNGSGKKSTAQKSSYRKSIATSLESKKVNENSSDIFNDEKNSTNIEVNNKKAAKESGVASALMKTEEKTMNSDLDATTNKTTNITENNTLVDTEKAAANNKKRSEAIVEKSVQNSKNNTVSTKTDKNNNIETSVSIKNDSTAVAMKTVEPNALEELLNEKEKQIESQESKISRWQIAPNIAPVYFNSSTNGSPIASEFENNNKSYDNNISFGLGVNYALNSKVSVRSGVNRVTLSYNTNDVVFYANLNNEGMRNIRQNVSGSMIVVEDEPQFTINSIDENIGLNEGSLNQSFGYVEVPLEFSYKFLDKKVGIQFIGGLSTLFLTENSVAIISDVATTTFGEANNLNNIHFSGNVGIGFNYGFSKSFQFNFEPMLKYQLNTFSSDAGNFRPYFIGLYSGISYRF